MKKRGKKIKICLFMFIAVIRITNASTFYSKPIVELSLKTSAEYPVVLYFKQY
jgi:hypothetical protein